MQALVRCPFLAPFEEAWPVQVYLHYSLAVTAWFAHRDAYNDEDPPEEARMAYGEVRHALRIITSVGH